MYDLEQIKELAAGVEHHLRRLEDFTEDMREIKASLDELRHSQEQRYFYELHKLQKDVARLSSELERRGLPVAGQYEKEMEDIRELLYSEKWPEAIEQSQICTDDQKVARACGILDGFIGEHLKGKRFLDYGCGEGHVVYEAQKREAEAFGYDIKCEPNNMFSKDFLHIQQQGPFDIILMHDVLDHIELINPIEALLQAKSVLKPDGRMYVRNHPWSSRHGGHLYNSINKAFLHLIMDEIELTRLGGHTCEYNIKVVTPIETYHYWFASAKLDIQDEFILRSKVEDLFTKPSLVLERISRHWDNTNTMIANLEIDFTEHVLVPHPDEEQLI